MSEALSVMHSVPSRLAQHTPALPHTDHAHPVVDAIGDIQIALRVYAAAVGPLQTGCRGGAAVAIATLVPTSDGGHDAGHGIDAADGIVFCVHDDNVVVMVAPDGLGRPQVAARAGPPSPL